MKDNISSLPGIYIHIPYCHSKCGYCDFYSVTNLNNKSIFIDALIAETKIVNDRLDSQTIFDTIYLGGGTPSLLEIRDLNQLFEGLFKQFNFAIESEITIEVNPGTLSKEKLINFRDLGINRLSIGIQSFIDRELQFLQRIHTSQQAIDTIHLAREAHFDNISIDLLFALPNQKIEDWQFNLEKGIALNPEHISAYNLIFEPDTPLYKTREAGQIEAKNESEELKFYKTTIETLKKSSYIQYEVSNFARDRAYLSKHNLKYWDHSNYLGFGPSAHSYWDSKRWSNVGSVDQYIKHLKKNQSPIDFEEIINQRTREFENIFLSLRTNIGLNLLDFEKYFKESFLLKYENKVKKLINQELAEIEDEYFRLTAKGLYISDEILAYFAHI